MHLQVGYKTTKAPAVTPALEDYDDALTSCKENATPDNKDSSSIAQVVDLSTFQLNERMKRTEDIFTKNIWLSDLQHSRLSTLFVSYRTKNRQTNGVIRNWTAEYTDTSRGPVNLYCHSGTTHLPYAQEVPSKRKISGSTIEVPRAVVAMVRGDGPSSNVSSSIDGLTIEDCGTRVFI